MVDLKKLLPKKGEEEEYYWSLSIEPGWVQAGIWKVEEKIAKVILISPITPWNLDEELIGSSDTALSSAIQGFPETLTEPSKTVFGVTSSWVDEGQISADYLEKIKKICSELSLAPIGFVVLPEALAHFKKSVEGSPLNAVTLGIYKESLEVSIFSQGKLLGTSQVARSLSLEDDVSEGLARFSGNETVPSRFLLYDGKKGELEDARQSLLKVDWEDFGKIKFLHTPKIEIVDVTTKILAVCLAGASELAGVESLEFMEGVFDEDKEPELKSVTEETEEKDEEYSDKKISINKLDLEKAEEASEENAEEGVGNKGESKEVEEKTPEDLGFVVGKDIASGVVSSDDVAKTQVMENEHENIRPVEGDNLAHKKNKPFGFGLKAKLGSLISKVSFPFPKIKAPKSSGFSAGKKIFVVAISFFVLVLGAGFASWWFLPKATVTIYLAPQKLGEKSTIQVDTGGGQTNLDDAVLSGEVVSVTVSGEKTKDTTGTKTVGEKAHGEIVLYRVGSELDLDSDTVVTGPEGLKFGLDTDVTVASGSASTPGTTKVKVTAKDIGAEYNLAGGTSFSVGNYSVSEIEAKNENAFSGGSSREISAVSADDIEVLEEDLSTELSDEAKNKLKDEYSGDKYFIDSSVQDSVTSKDFSADEGDEAKSLKLSMDVKAQAVLVDNETLNEYALKYLNDKVPSGYVLRKEQVTYEFDYDSEEDGIYDFKLGISANLLPQIGKEEIAEKLRGKYVNLAEDYLNKEITGFVRAEIKIKPNLPDKLKTMPHVAKNIEVEFAANK